MDVEPAISGEIALPACGEWRLDREIGRGAYGVVYLAEGPDGGWAAVKVCYREDIGEERYERELRGAKLYGAIPPQEELVHILELAEEPWGFYAVMELADDEFGRESPEAESYRPKTLSSVIDSVKAMPLAECVKLGITLAKGLVALQQYHLLHRDIKPGNVLYVEGRPVLSDPGLVVETSEAVSCVGTPGYAPSEGFTNDTGDIFSLGQTLKAASFGRHVEDIGKGPSLEAETDSKFFNAWWRILNKATDEDHRRRYQSATALLKALENLRRKMSLAVKFSSRRIIKILVVAFAIFLVKTIYNVRLNLFWYDASNSFYSQFASHCLSESLIYTKAMSSDTNVAAKVDAARYELSEISETAQANSRRFNAVKNIATEKYARGLDVEVETWAARRIIAREKTLQQRVLEIGRSVYGDEWRPSTMWSL